MNDLDAEESRSPWFVLRGAKVARIRNAWDPDRYEGSVMSNGLRSRGSGISDLSSG
jgi:hypothetical protein